MNLLSRSYLIALVSCLFFMSSFAEAGSLRNMVKVLVSTMIDAGAATASSQHGHDDLARRDHDDSASLEGMNAERELIMLPGSNFTEVEYLHTYMDSNQTNKQSVLVQENEFPSMFAGITFEYTSEYIMNFEYSIFNGPTNCKNCLVAIHKGNDCAKPKRRYWNKKSGTVPKNPWTKRNGAVLKTDSDGRGSGTMDGILSNGYTFDENLDRVVAIYDGHRLLFAKNPMKRAKMIACGVLKKVVA